MRYLSPLLLLLFSSVSFAGTEFICAQVVSLPNWGGTNFPTQIINVTDTDTATVVFGESNNSAGNNFYNASTPFAARISRNGMIWTFSGVRTDGSKPQPFSFKFDRANMKILDLGSDDNCVTVNAVPDMDFIAVQPGTFMMGSPITEVGREADETLGSVTLTKAFEMQSTSVTQAQWFSVMSTWPSWYRGDGYGGLCDRFIKLPPGAWGTVKQWPWLCPYRPVESVSYSDVQAFIKKLNSMQTTYTYRLPTEAEFEYAMRSGSSSPYFWGANLNDDSKYVCGTGCEGSPYDVGRYSCPS